MELRAYGLFGLNLMLSLLIMYLAMFAMIWSRGEFIQNINFLYMALVMWAPMAAVMLLTMRPMYRNVRLNIILHAVFALVFVLSLAGIRAQALVGDEQFVRSMIPHHSGAVLMCQRAKITDPEIEQLCGNIIRSQTEEIAQMKAILKRL
jgi:uncharacterized protein (DUF305 family)